MTVQHSLLLAKIIYRECIATWEGEELGKSLVYAGILGILFESGSHGGARGRFAGPDFELAGSLLQQHVRTVNDGAALLFGSLQQQRLMRVVDHIEHNVRGNHITEEGFVRVGRHS